MVRPRSIGFEVQLVDWAKQPAGAHSLRAIFQKVVWERIEGATSFDAPNFEPVYTLVASTDFSTSDQGQARLAFTPPEPGTYQLTVEGEGASSDLMLWVGGTGQAVWPNLPNQRLRLTADKEFYIPSEIAHLFNFWVWFEGMAISSYLLVAFYREQAASLEAGMKYLVQSAIGSVMVLMGIALVLANAGTLDLSGIREAVSGSDVNRLALLGRGRVVHHRLRSQSSDRPTAYMAA